MRKGIGIIAVLLVILAFTGPVSADSTSASTSVTVNGATGDPPIIKCKWETTNGDDGENGDPTHLVDGTQVKAPGTYDGTQKVIYWAVVTDDNGASTVADVSAKVYHPDGSFKYKVLLDNKITNADTAKLNVQAAFNAGLLVLNEGYTLADILEELEQTEAYLWKGSEDLHYCQPAGEYTVEMNAADNNNGWAEPLNNTFDYMELGLCEFDFSAIAYNNVEVTYETVAGGDTDFGTADKPTIRNIGNLPLNIQIAQDDMGLGRVGFDGDWNVNYKVRLGSYPNTEDEYDPVHFKDDTWTPDDCDYFTMTDILPLCNTNKLDFFITVLEGQPGDYEGKIYLKCVPA